MSDALVEARAVSRSYGSGPSAVEAVKGATCVISAGDLIALVGPSGSGKSTLLYLLAGLEPPSSGAIAWPSAAAGKHLTPNLVGFAFQVPNLLAPLTAIDNVALPLLIAGVSADLARSAASSMLERFDLLDVAGRYPEDLSGGQAERVGVARALVTEPAIVLADEPTGQLDGRTALHVIDRLLAAVEHAGAALIVATHDERIARRFRTRWTMDHGVLVTAS